jgi:hypothetical protein
MSRARALLAAVPTVMSVGLLVLPAGAVDRVDINFDIGEYDATRNDWPIETVIVTGDLRDGVPFVVELLGPGDVVVWSAEVDFEAPQTRIPVDGWVGVAEVTRAGVAQEEAGIDTLGTTTTTAAPPLAPTSSPPTTARATTTSSVSTTTPTTTTETTEPRTPRSEVPAEILGTAAGGGNAGGRVALSVILAAVVLALVFRLPLPFASTPRWRK